MFEKFTERARKVMTLSRQEAQRLNMEFIGTEHILLGIIQEGGGVAAKALKSLGVDKDAMMKEIEKIVTPTMSPTAPPRLPTMPFSPRAKRALNLTSEEACRAGCDVIATEHLLLGVFMEREGITAQVMDTFGIKEKTLRAKIDEINGREPQKADVAVTATVSMHVWVFKESKDVTPALGKLYLKGAPAVNLDRLSTVVVEGIPAESCESIAEAIAINCGAVGYMIEILKPA